MRPVVGTYRCSPPLIRPSKLTSKENGGVGKDLSDGYNVNFAVGCRMGCQFCYVDAIHKRFGPQRYGDAVKAKWGDYLLVPSNIQEAIDKTRWERWAGKEVMMSSTHDPFLPETEPWARLILERALPKGVRFCIQTRAYLVLNHLQLLVQYREQIRLQVSIATMNRGFARLIEPRVPPPERRLEVLGKAKEAGLCTGVILAPIFPFCGARPHPSLDILRLAEAIAEIRPDHVYGESLHVRGMNMTLIEEALGENVSTAQRGPDGTSFDEAAEYWFHNSLERYGMKGTWWPEGRGDAAAD